MDTQRYEPTRGPIYIVALKQISLEAPKRCLFELLPRGPGCLNERLADFNRRQFVDVPVPNSAAVPEQQGAQSFDFVSMPVGESDDPGTQQFVRFGLQMDRPQRPAKAVYDLR